MIRVNIIEDERIIRSVEPNMAQGDKMAWAQEYEKYCGHILFSGDGQLKHIADNDNVAELLVRAALNHLDLQGVKTAYSRSEAMKAQLLALGFLQKGDTAQADIKSFFKPCRHCK